MGHLLNKLFANSEFSAEENTTKIYVSKWVFIWKNGVYVGYHKTK